MRWQKFKNRCQYLSVVLILTSACNRAELPSGLLPTRTPAPQPNPALATANALAECTQTKLDLTAPPIATGSANGQIGYITIDGNIAVMDATGRGVKDITTDANLDDRSRDLISYRFPTFSNDSKNIAFVSIRSSVRTQGMTQTVHTAPTENRPKITNVLSTIEDNIPYFDWSPDDQSLAILGINPTAGSIKVISSTGGTARIFDNGTTVYWHWRKDSAALFAHLGGSTGFNRDAKMSVGDARNATARKITLAPGDFQAPQFSPNGKYVLVVVNTNNSNELVLSDSDGNVVCRVTTLTDGGFFAWSPDGKRIALMDTASPVFEPAPIDIIEIASGKRTRVHEQATAFFWSPNGQRLAIYSVRSAAESGGVPNDLVGLKQTADPNLDMNTVPLLRIEFFDVSSGKSTLIADTLPTRDFVSLLGYFDQYSRALTPWSPDSTKLVLTGLSLPRETTDIAVANITSSGNIEIKPIGGGTLAFWSTR